jgi:hypothetical protein
LNPGIVLFTGTSELRASRNLSKTGANIIYHGFEPKNSSFERILFQKHAKKFIWGGVGSGSESKISAL